MNKYEQTADFPVTLPGTTEPEPEDKNDWSQELEDFLTRPTYVETIKRASTKRGVTDEMSFAHDLKENWAIYVFLVISSVFTAMLGFYLGTAPKLLDDGSLFFHTDPGHLFTAIMYMVSFVGITEFAFALAKRKYYIREHKNDMQGGVMLAMMVVAGISILGTGITGGIVVASTIDFLTAFVKVPDWAQYWVVRILPALFLLYSVLLTVYALSSNKAETNRILEGRRHARALDSKTRQEGIKQMLEEKLEIAAAARYIALVEAGKMSKAEATARFNAERMLSLDEETPARPTNGQQRKK